MNVKINAWCVHCDRRFLVELDRHNRAVHPKCKACGGEEWSRRPVAEAHALVEKNIKLAYYAAGRTGIGMGVIEVLGGLNDWNAQALLLLTRAAYRWDKDYRNADGMAISFATYAIFAIERSLKGWCTSELRKGYAGRPLQNEQGWTVGYDANLSLDYCTESGSLTNVLAQQPVTETWDEDERRLARESLGKLDPRAARVMELRYLSGWTLGKIGNELKLSKEGVRQIIVRATKRLRSVLSN